MSSRDRDTKSLQDKLKVFFKKGASAPLPAVHELVVSAELERELRSDAAPARRLRALRDLGDRARVTRIQQGGSERLWALTRDLLDDACAESRHTALWFLRCIAEGQECAVMRTIMFRYLRETHAQHAAEDAPHRLALLATLTNGGKNIECFEEQIGEYLLEYMRSVGEAGEPELLSLVTNVVKFNATYLDEHILHGIVEAACHLCAYSAEAGIVGSALALLQAVGAYSWLPRAALPAFVGALCRTVNLERHCQTSWKLMRSVLGADLGHAALQELAALPTAGGAGGAGAGGTADAGAVRGAVFYINMALWGPRPVPSLRTSPHSVLPALLQAVNTNQPVVTYEVIQAVQSLITRARPDSLCAAWDVLLLVLKQALQHDKSLDPPNELIHTRLHALLTSIEQLHEAGQYSGDPDSLLDLIESCAHDRPEASVLRLINLRCGALSPARAEWLAHAHALGDKFVRRDPRLAVRLHALQRLLALVVRHRFAYEEEVLLGVGVPLLGWCAAGEPALRAAAARATAELAVLATGDANTDLVDLLEKIMNRPFETEEPNESDPEPDLTDVTLAVSGLLDVFHAKLLRAPAAHAARACLVLLDHLDHALHHPRYPARHAPCRKKILDMIFGLRTNAYNSVGFCYDATGAPVYGAAALRIKPLCSPSLLAEPLAARGQHPAPSKDLPPGTCILPVGRCARILQLALSREKEWSVLQHVLRALPALLQARALCVGRRAQDLDLLASTLCAMVSDRTLAFPECLRGQKVLMSELHAAVLPSLGALAPYHAFLEPLTQHRVVRCLLRYGMVLRTPAPYLAALTQFTLEARDTMVKLLPEVLLDLSKVSDTKLIAGPMLEFLSTLTRLPRVFASFVEDQYMSVFAILLPYTNPSRYNHYVVSLAHHVVAAWFLKCRLSYRRNFVRFIIHGLHNYIIMPFEEQLHNYKVHAPANEDSSNRKRSSSLGSRGVSAAPLGAGGGAGSGAGAGGGGAGRASAASASAAFHVELTEACVDLLARYTASPCSVKPQRSDAAEWMFSGGQSMTWLVGHKLVTITTAGCAQNSLKQGMCDRCLALVRAHADSAPPPAPPAPAPPAPPAPPAAPHDASPAATAVVDGSHSQNHNLQVTNPPEVKRQNSSEYNPIVEALNNFTQRFEKISKEVDTEEAGWSRAGEMAAGACPCWCADWAEIHVRSPSGDVAWLMRVQNQMGWDNQSESSLQDILALLAPPAPPVPSAPGSTLSDRTNNASESESRSRSGSSASQTASSQPQDLHKSSSDSVVATEKKPPHAATHCIGPPQPLRMSTQPINIPGSPVRGASELDMLLVLPEGKSRHPVRRSNSSPEMSSWKLARDEPAAAGAAGAGAAGARPAGPAPAPEPGIGVDPDLMILLPGTEPSSCVSLHASKKAAKKSDMRVSCEAIPEEMSGSSPLAHPAVAVTHPHPHLQTYNSDPGAGPASDDKSESQLPLQKVASDSVVTAAAPAARAHRPPAPVPAASPPPRPPPPPPVAERDDLPPLARSKRSNTISVMSPTRRHRDQSSASLSKHTASSSNASSSSVASAGAGGVTPSFVLLQLYHKMSTYPITPPVPGEVPSAQNPLAERPLLVSGVQHERTIKNLDRVPPIETYKVGVLYVGPGQQDNEVLILKNEYGSVRYAEFLGQLGTLVSLAGSGAGLLEGASQQALFLNLEQGGKDGRYTYVWHDDVMQVLFHVATAMPAAAADPTCNEKRKYIGNDYVSIVYNDSGGDFSIHTIKGQFNLCIVVVEPCEHGLHRVVVKTKDERIRSRFLPHLEQCAQVVSDQCAAQLARQLALHCALASHISQSLSLGGGAQPYASNSLERLRHIKRLRRRVEEERLQQAARAPKPYAPQGDTARRVAMDDFNDYT